MATCKVEVVGEYTLFILAKIIELGGVKDEVDTGRFEELMQD